MDSEIPQYDAESCEDVSSEDAGSPESFGSAADAVEFEKAESEKVLRRETESTHRKFELAERIELAADELGVSHDDLMKAIEKLQPLFDTRGKEEKEGLLALFEGFKYVSQSLDFLLDCVGLGEKINAKTLDLICNTVIYLHRTEEIPLDAVPQIIFEYQSIGMLKDAYDFMLKKSFGDLERLYGQTVEQFKYCGLSVFQFMEGTLLPEGKKKMAFVAALEMRMNGAYYFALRLDEKNTSVIFVYRSAPGNGAPADYTFTLPVDMATIQRIKDARLKAKEERRNGAERGDETEDFTLGTLDKTELKDDIAKLAESVVSTRPEDEGLLERERRYSELRERFEAGVDEETGRLLRGLNDGPPGEQLAQFLDDLARGGQVSSDEMSDYSEYLDAVLPEPRHLLELYDNASDEDRPIYEERIREMMETARQRASGQAEDEELGSEGVSKDMVNADETPPSPKLEKW